MKLHQRFDLNLGSIKSLGRELFALPPYVVEDLVGKLTKKGYTVIKSSANYVGVPSSITVVKEFTGPFVTNFSSKIRDDFKTASERLGIGNLFE